MNDPKIYPRTHADRPTARKKALTGVFHASVMLLAGWFLGHNVHPAVEFIFYGLGLIAAVYSAYFSYRHFVSVRASKTVKH